MAHQQDRSQDDHANARSRGGKDEPAARLLSRLDSRPLSKQVSNARGAMDDVRLEYRVGGRLRLAGDLANDLRAGTIDAAGIRIGAQRQILNRSYEFLEVVT